MAGAHSAGQEQVRKTEYHTRPTPQTKRKGCWMLWKHKAHQDIRESFTEKEGFEARARPKNREGCQAEGTACAGLLRQDPWAVGVAGAGECVLQAAGEWAWARGHLHSKPLMRFYQEGDMLRHQSLSTFFLLTVCLHALNLKVQLKSEFSRLVFIVLWLWH